MGGQFRGSILVLPSLYLPWIVKMMTGSSCVAVLVAVTVLVLVFVAATAQDCSLDGYDLDTLKKWAQTRYELFHSDYIHPPNNNFRQSYWEVDVDVGHCHHYYQGGTCTVYFSTCGTLPRELCGVEDAAVCQVAMSQDRNDRTSFVLGTAATRSLSPLCEYEKLYTYLDVVTPQVVYKCSTSCVCLIQLDVHLICLSTY